MNNDGTLLVVPAKAGFKYSVSLVFAGCHSEERSDEESQRNNEILRFAQKDDY
jgi:hypothetical protein